MEIDKYKIEGLHFSTKIEICKIQKSIIVEEMEHVSRRSGVIPRVISELCYQDFYLPLPGGVNKDIFEYIDANIFNLLKHIQIFELRDWFVLSSKDFKTQGVWVRLLMYNSELIKGQCKKIEYKKSEVEDKLVKDFLLLYEGSKGMQGINSFDILEQGEKGIRSGYDSYRVARL